MGGGEIGYVVSMICQERERERERSYGFFNSTHHQEGVHIPKHIERCKQCICEMSKERETE